MGKTPPLGFVGVTVVGGTGTLRFRGVSGVEGDWLE